MPSRSSNARPDRNNGDIILASEYSSAAGRRTLKENRHSFSYSLPRGRGYTWLFHTKRPARFTNGIENTRPRPAYTREAALLLSGLPKTFSSLVAPPRTVSRARRR